MSESSSNFIYTQTILTQEAIIQKSGFPRNAKEQGPSGVRIKEGNESTIIFISKRMF